MAEVKIYDDGVALANADGIDFRSPLLVSVAGGPPGTANVSINTITIQSLAAVGAAKTDDVFVLVTNTASTPVTEKITVGSLFGGVNVASTFKKGLTVLDSNVALTNAVVYAGNSTVNSTVSATLLKVSNSTMNASVTTNGMVVSVSTYGSAGPRIGSNLTINTSSFYVGNSTTNSTSLSSSFKLATAQGNVTINSTSVTVGNGTATAALSMGLVTISNGGSISIPAPSTVEAAATNYFLCANGSWQVPSVGSAAPAGSNTQVQYNSSGTTAASAAFVFDSATNSVSIQVATTGRLTVGNSTINVQTNSTSIVLGANSEFTNARWKLGNSTVNAAANSTQLLIRDGAGSSVVNSSAVSTGTGVFSVAATIGSGASINTTALFIGNSTSNSILTDLQMKVGNTTEFFLANSTYLTIDGAASAVNVFSDRIAMGNSSVNTSLTIPTSAQWSATNAFLHANGSWATVRPIETLVADVSRDETTTLTTGTAKWSWRPPFAMTLAANPVAVLGTNSSSGTITLDVNEGGVSIFSTLLTVDVNEGTSNTAAIPAVMSDTTIAQNALVTIDVDGAGTGAKGLKVVFQYYR